MGAARDTNIREVKFRVLVGKPEEMRPLRRPINRWEDNLVLDLTEIGWETVDWIHLAQNRDKWRTLVDTIMNLQAP